MKKIELVAPAGDLLKLKIAFLYGADAVYASIPRFTMRSREIDFNLESLAEGINYAHKIGKKLYITINTFPHSSEIKDYINHISKMIDLKPDALIVADPGLVNYISKNYKIPIHLSTQSNTTNHLSAQFWQDNGVKRIVLARELSLKDIKIITKKLDIPIEVFVHGAMCMAYSGRCQISNYLAGRDPNKGKCIQACRFKYQLYGLKEEMRPNDIFPIIEEDNASYILNSKDLCMINHIPDLIKSGVGAFKIEGRLKSEYYLGSIVKLYREALDLALNNPKKFEQTKSKLFNDVLKTTNRGFTTGFYYNKPDISTNNYQTHKEWGTYLFAGIIRSYNNLNNFVTIEAKQPLVTGDIIEIIARSKIIKHKIIKMKKNNKYVSRVTPADLFEIKIINSSLEDNLIIRIANKKIVNNLKK